MPNQPTHQNALMEALEALNYYKDSHCISTHPDARDGDTIDDGETARKAIAVIEAYLASPAPSEEADLPPLPEFGIIVWEDFGLGDRTCHEGYTADQMKEYALAARADLLKQNEELKAAALWVLYHHQGGLSPIGQPIRRLLGIGQWDDLTDEQMATVEKFAMKEPTK